MKDTPLSGAVRNGHTNIVRLLIEDGSEKQAIVPFPNFNNTFGKGAVIFKMTFTVEKLLQVHFFFSSHTFKQVFRIEYNLISLVFI